MCSNPSEWNPQTLFHENNQLVEKTIDRSLIFDNEVIKNKYIHELKVFKLDSITFEDDNPDNTVFWGIEIQLDMNRGFIEHQKHQAEDYAIFTAFHLTNAINRYNNCFEGKLDFDSQDDYKIISIYLGNASYLSNPKEFVIEPNSKPSPTLIYHEIGHRAFWLIEDDLGIDIGGANNYIHVGLIEYFTASFANYPIILEGVVPEKMTRNVARRIKYPDNFVSLNNTMELILDAYNEKIDSEPWHKVYYNLLKKNVGHLNSLKDGHRSGMLISHPLWTLRNLIGHNNMDLLVAKTILNLPNSMKNRKIYAGKFINSEQDPIEWYDLYYGLVWADRQFFEGVNIGNIAKVFSECGYKVTQLKLSNYR